MEYTQNYKRRLKRHYDELKWLYSEMYGDGSPAFNWLLHDMERLATARDVALRQQDVVREGDPIWYRDSAVMGMSVRLDAFAGTLNGMCDRLDYLVQCGVRFVHVSPLLESPEDKSDDGRAISNFEQVCARFGSMDDLAQLTGECRARGISLCTDLVLNHTSDAHPWAVQARAGKPEYMDRYFIYDNFEIPAHYERTVPQALPESAPGNFTYLPEIDKFVMTTFHEYEWDLNYANPIVFNGMVHALLCLANQGVEAICLDTLPYIWKQLGSTCRNLPRVHTLLRMLRMICETVCPSVVLVGNVDSPPEQAVAYFGVAFKPECHMLYDDSMSAHIWHTAATGDVRLLSTQFNCVNNMRRAHTFINRLRADDGICWNIDYASLSRFNMTETLHRRFLNEYFTGAFPGSTAQGDIYSDGSAGGVRQCGTTASLCGLESALASGLQPEIGGSAGYVIMLYAYIFVQSGMPMLCGGDEIGQLNDYSYRSDAKRAADTRWLQRGAMNWDAASMIHSSGKYQHSISSGIVRLERIRNEIAAFGPSANVLTIPTYDDAVICIVRQTNTDKLVALYNFKSEPRMAWIDERDGLYTELISGKRMYASGVRVAGHEFMWLYRELEGSEAVRAPRDMAAD